MSATVIPPSESDVLRGLGSDGEPLKATITVTNRRPEFGGWWVADHYGWRVDCRGRHASGVATFRWLARRQAEVAARRMLKAWLGITYDLRPTPKGGRRP